MLGVVAHLDGAPTVGLVDGLLHALRDGIGIHNHLAVHVARRASRGLRQCPVAPQEPFFVGVDDGDERHLGQVETFTQQVHAHEHVENPGTEVAHNLHAVQGGHVAVDVVGADAVVQQIFCQFLCHALGEGGGEHTLVAVYTSENLVHQVVYLVLAGPHLYLGVEEPGRTDELFHHHALGLLQLEVGGSGRHIYHLFHHLLELVEAQRTVVEGGGQAEAILHEVGLAGTIAAIHRVDLRHTHMTLVYHHQVVVREEVEQTVGLLSGLAPVEIA